MYFPLLDESNNLVSKTLRDGSKTLYAYDANGNVVKETRFDGAVSTFAYDSKNRLITSVDFNGATTKYTYENDNLTVVENSDGSKTLYEYDDLHRVTKETDANGNNLVNINGKLNITADQAEIEVLSEGGLFKKAKVLVTKKQTEGEVAAKFVEEVLKKILEIRRQTSCSHKSTESLF